MRRSLSKLRVQSILTLCFVLLVAAAFLFTTSCRRGGSGADSSNAGGPTKLKVAYLGLTCEAPIFAAYEKGFFEEEGLEVELVRTDWDGLREGLGTGQFDANHTLVMYLLKPIESGVDVKMTGGIHKGCLRVQVAKNSEMKSVAELKGKTIGVPTHIGSPPYLFCCRTLAAAGIDPRPEANQVKWVPYPPAELGLALSQGKIDALATSDPIGTILLGKGTVKTISDQAEDEPYKGEYCCASVVSGKLAKQNPAAAAKVTRALLKGAKWVSENPTAAAKLSVEKKYIASTVEINSQALLKLDYLPAVARCKQSIDQAAVEMKQAGLLKPSTDPAALAKRAWIDLDGVTDEWIAHLKVEKVANGGRKKQLDPVGFAALFEGRKGCLDSCCIVE
ncbi:MAG TPA: ABC transporter substrate-binding protein [Gemmataceae bacterium]|nr:ABC transporter substrate-binding protein [Gemmataceae bacterium]